MRLDNWKEKLIAVPRPYTAYNVFFQLEREYILQNVFNVVPGLNVSEIFDHDPKEYKGPRLPSRYSEIILHREWYMPGKGRRNKRSHRASHGKIGFKELSKQIAKSWASVDAETKQFCETYSEECKIQYKSIISNMACPLLQSKSSDIVVEPVVSNPEISMLADDRASATSGRASPPFQQAAVIHKARKVLDDSEMSEIISNPEAIMHVNHETSASLDRKGHTKMQEAPEALNEITIDTLFSGLPLLVNDEALVDMDDNKIIDLWNSVHHWGNTPSF